MIYTLHFSKDMYEVIETTIDKHTLSLIWKEFCEDENATDFDKWCKAHGYVVVVIETGTIHYKSK